MSTGKASVENLPGNAGGGSHQRDRDHEYFVAFPNRWAFIRNMYLRDFALEALGKSYIHSLSLSSSSFIIPCNLLRHYDDYNARLSSVVLPQ